MFIYVLTYFLYIIFYNLKSQVLIKTDIINLKIWNYVYILNNNSNSILLIILMLLFLINFKKINFKFDVNLLLTVLFALILKNTDLEDTNNSIFVSNLKFININLINGILLIHPFIMYWCYVLFLLCTYLFFFQIRIINKNIINIKKMNKILLLTSFISLFLGSY